MSQRHRRHRRSTPWASGLHATAALLPQTTPEPAPTASSDGTKFRGEGGGAPPTDPGQSRRPICPDLVRRPSSPRAARASARHDGDGVESSSRAPPTRPGGLGDPPVRRELGEPTVGRAWPPSWDSQRLGALEPLPVPAHGDRSDRAAEAGRPALGDDARRSSAAAPEGRAALDRDTTKLRGHRSRGGTRAPPAPSRAPHRGVGERFERDESFGASRGLR